MEREDAMNETNEKKVVVELHFKPQAQYRPVLESVRRDARLSLNRLRARLSLEEAWFEFEIAGDPAAVDKFLARNRHRIETSVAVA